MPSRPLYLLTLAAFLIGTATAAAQTRPPRRPPPPPRPTPHAGSLEIGGGITWSGGFGLGSAEADLTRNPSTGTGPYELFGSGSKLGQGVGLQAHLTGYVSRSFAVEGGLRFTRPVLAVSLSNDAESAPNQRAEETLTQYVIEGSAVWHFGALGGGKAVPFVSGGAGYIRDLHEGSELIQTGTEYHATGGVKLWFSTRPRRLGLRGEAGVSIRDGGFDFREGTRTVPIASAGLVYLF